MGKWLCVSIIWIFLSLSLAPLCAGQLPVILTHPSDGYVAREKPHTLRCDVVESTSPKPDIFWYKDWQRVSTQYDNPASVHSILNNGNLFFLRFQQSDAGTYYCNATNSYGSAISRNASLQLAVLRDEFRQSPTSVSAVLAGEVTLSCQPPRGHPNPLVKWKVNGTMIDVSSNRRMSIKSPGNLEITNVRRSDQGSYVCVASNVAGTRHSAVAHLRVLEAPVIMESPADLLINQGDSVTFRCQASGDPAPRITWVKVGDNLDSSRTRVTEENSLKISNVDSSDEGSYSCIASNDGGNTQATAHLTVHTPPVFLRKPVSKTVGKGSLVVFRCVVDGKPPPTIYWSKVQDDQLLYVGQTVDRYSVLEDGTLQIRDSESQDDGEYKCTAVNGAGRNVSTASLRVRNVADSSPPPVITETPQNVTVIVNHNAELQCKASGNPLPTIRWNHNGRPVLVDSRISINRGNLKITDVRVTDSGQYTCLAISKSGEASAEGYLNIVGVAYNTVETLLPPAPGKPEAHEADITETTVKLFWGANSENSAGVTYSVEYFTRQNREGWLSYPDKTSATWNVVTGLDPGTSYVMVVRAHNEYGSSEPSPRSEYIKVLGGPENPGYAWTKAEMEMNLETVTVRLLSADVLSSTALNVSWSVEHGDRQYIEGYHVTLTSTMGSETYIVYSSLSTYRIVTNLLPYTQYRVDVSPFYESATATPSMFLTATMKEDVPSGPPMQVSVEDNSNYIVVDWEEPKPSHMNGEIIGYVVVCNAEDRELSRNYTANASQFQMIVKDLNRKTSYKIGVAARTKVGTGIISRMWPVEAIIAADTLTWQMHVIIGVVCGVVLVVFCIVVACLCRRQSKNGKTKQRAADNNLVTVPLQNVSGPSPMYVQYQVEHGSSGNSAMTRNNTRSPDVMNQRSFQGSLTNRSNGSGFSDQNMDNYNGHNASQFKTFYNKSETMSTGPYATTVILRNMPDRDESLIPRESPQNTLNGVNVHNSCDSSCTDNNATRDLTSNSSGENAALRASPPALPSFAVPPPPNCPPPNSSGDQAQAANSLHHTAPRYTQAHVGQSTLPFHGTHCQTCLRGYPPVHNTLAGSHQLPPSYVLNNQGRPNNQHPMPHNMHSFPHNHAGLGDNNEYQLTYPSMQRGSGSNASHQYQPYLRSVHGHSSDSHDYAEPQFELDNTLYAGVPMVPGGHVGTMPPIAHQIIPPPHLIHHHAHQQHPTHNIHRLRQQTSMPAHISQQQGLPQQRIPVSAVQRHQSLPSSEQSNDLCPSCAENTEYEEPWTDQHWPDVWNQHHHLHHQQHPDFDDDDGEEEPAETQLLNPAGEEGGSAQSSVGDKSAGSNKTLSCSGSEDSKSERRKQRRKQRAQQQGQGRSSSPYNGYSTDSSIVFVPRKPYPKSSRKRQMNSKPKNTKSLSVQVENEELSQDV